MLPYHGCERNNVPFLKDNDDLYIGPLVPCYITYLRPNTFISVGITRSSSLEVEELSDEDVSSPGGMDKRKSETESVALVTRRADGLS